MLNEIERINLYANIRKLWYRFEGPKHLPKKQKRKQKEFAEFIGISEQYLSMILNNIRIGQNQIIKISKAVGVSVEDLVSDNFDKIINKMKSFKKNNPT